MSSKSPFISYTPEQIVAFEAVTYVIVAGSDFFDVNGNFFFSKNSAVRYYNKILRQLEADLAGGNQAEKKNARRVLGNLKVERMRVH